MTERYLMESREPHATGCSCQGTGVIIEGSLFEKPGLSFRPCVCALDHVAARQELLALRRRWDALASEHAVSEAYYAMFGIDFCGTDPPPMPTRALVTKGLQAAREAALHVDGDTTEFLDSEAQKRIADLEQRLQQMTVGRGRLAVIIHNFDRGALTSIDHDAMKAYETQAGRDT